MSEEADPDEGGRPAKIGRGRPPIEHRFRKGRSGNPTGRPRKSSRAKAPLSSDELLLEEAARRIVYNDRGGKLSVEQLAIRAQASKAIKGDPRAQKDFVASVRVARQREAERSLHLVVDLAQLKDRLDEQLSGARKRRQSPPDVFPHPDNIVVDPLNGAVWIFGGPTPEAQAVRTFLRHFERYLMLAIEETQVHLRDNPGDKDSAWALKWLRGEAAKVRAIGDLDPPLYAGPLPEDTVRPPYRPSSRRLDAAGRHLLKLPALEGFFRETGLDRVLGSDEFQKLLKDTD